MINEGYQIMRINKGASFKEIIDGKIIEHKSETELSRYQVESVFKNEIHSLTREIEIAIGQKNTEHAKKLEELQNISFFIAPIYHLLHKILPASDKDAERFKTYYEIAKEACAEAGINKEYLNQSLFRELVTQRSFKKVNPIIQNFIIEQTNVNVKDYSISNLYSASWPLGYAAAMKDTELLEKLLPKSNIKNEGNFLTKWNGNFEKHPLIDNVRYTSSLNVDDFELLYASSFADLPKKGKKGKREEFEKFIEENAPFMLQYENYANNENKTIQLSRELALYFLFVEINIPALNQKKMTTKHFMELKAFAKNNEILKMSSFDEEAILYLVTKNDAEHLKLFANWKFNAGEGRAFEALVKTARTEKDNSNNLQMQILLKQSGEAKKYFNKTEQDIVNMWMEHLNLREIYSNYYNRYDNTEDRLLCMKAFMDTLKQSFNMIYDKFGETEYTEKYQKAFAEKVNTFVFEKIKNLEGKNLDAREQKNLIEITFMSEDLFNLKALNKKSLPRI